MNHLDRRIWFEPRAVTAHIGCVQVHGEDRVVRRTAKTRTGPRPTRQRKRVRVKRWRRERHVGESFKQWQRRIGERW